MDPLELLKLLHVKSEDEKRNLMLLVVHVLLTTTQDGEFEVSMETLEDYTSKGDHDLTFERSPDGFVRLRAITNKKDDCTMGSKEAEEMNLKARALVEALINVIGETKHGKH